MRSFREAQKSTPSAPKRQWAYPPPEAPQGAADELAASELESGSHTLPAGRARHKQGQPGSRQRHKDGRYKESRPAGGKKVAGRVEKGTGEDEQATERGTARR